MVTLWLGHFRALAPLRSNNHIAPGHSVLAGRIGSTDEFRDKWMVADQSRSQQASSWLLPAYPAPSKARSFPGRKRWSDSLYTDICFFKYLSFRTFPQLSLLFPACHKGWPRGPSYGSKLVVFPYSSAPILSALYSLYEDSIVLWI